MYGQFGSFITGAIAAATNGTIATVRYPEITVARWGQRMRLKRLHLQITTLVSFNTSVTAGRGLKLVRAANDAAGTANPTTGGTAFTFGSHRVGDSQTLAVGRQGTTGAITTTGFTAESAVIERVALAHCGVAGANYDEVWVFDGVSRKAVDLPAGYAFFLQTDGALDAGGSIQVQGEFELEETDR